MKIVIKIPERDYHLACRYPDALIATYAHYIRNGTPLPKGCGRLVDGDALRNEMIQTFKKYCNANACDVCVECVRLADTIIEADTTRDCKTCGHLNDGKCAGTEECHECMWVNKYIEADKGRRGMNV